MAVIDITSEAQLDKILAENAKVVIDFHAEWCGPCKHFKPTFVARAATHLDIKFVAVNVDDQEEVASRYEVQAMPTFKFIKGGNVVHTQVGANPTEFDANLAKLNTVRLN